VKSDWITLAARDIVASFLDWEAKAGEQSQCEQDQEVGEEALRQFVYRCIADHLYFANAGRPRP
jgi:hypothetical protein